jgi:hypothetical protein
MVYSSVMQRVWLLSDRDLLLRLLSNLALCHLLLVLRLFGNGECSGRKVMDLTDTVSKRSLCSL